MNTITSKRAIVVTALSMEGLLYKAGVECVNDTDAEFGRNIRTLHKKANIVIGRIEGMQKTEDRKSLSIQVVHVNPNGIELEDDKGKPRVETFKIPLKGDYPYNEDTWTTDQVQAVSQVDKINDQYISGMLPILEMIQEHIDMVKNAKSFSRSAEVSESDEQSSLDE